MADAHKRFIFKKLLPILFRQRLIKLSRSQVLAIHVQSFSLFAIKGNHGDVLHVSFNNLPQSLFLNAINSSSFNFCNKFMLCFQQLLQKKTKSNATLLLFLTSCRNLSFSSMPTCVILTILFLKEIKYF